MRTASDIINDYRSRGYTDDRLRILAKGRPEPMRSDILEILDSEAEKNSNLGEMLEDLEIDDTPPAEEEISQNCETEEEMKTDESPASEHISKTKEEIAPETVTSTAIIAEKSENVLLNIEFEETIELSIDNAESCENTMNERTMTLIIDESFDIPKKTTTSSEKTISSEDDEETESQSSLFNANVDAAVSSSMIELAYNKDGIYVKSEEEIEEELASYIPPELTLIDCEQEPVRGENDILTLSPEYALSEDERIEAKNKMENDLYYMLAEDITTNFSEIEEDVKRDELQSTCADFDAIARPADSDWLPTPVEVKVEFDENSITGFKEIENWMQEVEGIIKARKSKTSKLYGELAQRDDTIVVQGREMDMLRNHYQALQEQVKYESTQLATAQRIILEQKDKLNQAENEIKIYARDLEKRNDLITSSNSIIAGQSEQIVSLRALIDDLSAGADTIIKHNVQIEAMLAGREQELANIQDELNAQRKSEKEFSELQKEYNILATETVPNLQKDKEDLTEIIGEEIGKVQTLDELASKRQRRLSYTMSLATAACLMLVLMPVLSWNSIQSDKAQMEIDFATRIAQAESVQDALESERDALRDAISHTKAEFANAKAEWQTTLSSLSTKHQQEIMTIQASIIQERNNEFDNATFDMPATESVETAQTEEYNSFSGVDEWRVRKGESNTPAIASISGSNINDEAEADNKIVKVKRGEGLSQVIWRVYGTTSPEMVKRIAKINNLKKDRRGQPLLRINQKLTLPANAKTAMR